MTESLSVGWRAVGTVEPGCPRRRQGAWMPRAVTAEVAVLLELMEQERALSVQSSLTCFQCVFVLVKNFPLQVCLHHVNAWCPRRPE